MSTPYATPQSNLISLENEIIRKAKSPIVIRIIFLIISCYH